MRRSDACRNAALMRQQATREQICPARYLGAVQFCGTAVWGHTAYRYERVRRAEGLTALITNGLSECQSGLEMLRPSSAGTNSSCGFWTGRGRGGRMTENHKPRFARTRNVAMAEKHPNKTSTPEVA